MVCSTCTTAFHELCSKYGLVTLCALPSVRTGVISVYLYYDLEEHTVYFWSSGVQKESIVTYLVLEERQWLCLAHFLLTTCPLERHALILKSFKGLTCVSSGFWHLSYCNFVVQQSTVLEKQKVWPYLLWLETSTKSESWWCELMPSSYNNFNIFRKNRYNFRSLTGSKYQFQYTVKLAKLLMETRPVLVGPECLLWQPAEEVFSASNLGVPTQEAGTTPSYCPSVVPLQLSPLVFHCLGSVQWHTEKPHDVTLGTGSAKEEVGTELGNKDMPWIGITQRVVGREQNWLVPGECLKSAPLHLRAAAAPQGPRTESCVSLLDWLPAVATEGASQFTSLCCSLFAAWAHRSTHQSQCFSSSHSAS